MEPSNYCHENIWKKKKKDQPTEQGVKQPIHMYGHFSHDDNKDISVHGEKDPPLNKWHQDNWQKCKSKKTNKKTKPKTYTIKLLGINVEDSEDRERFLKSINAKANQVKKSV